MRARKVSNQVRLLASVWGCVFAVSCFARLAGAASATLVRDVEWQPLEAQAQRLIEAMDYVGSPIGPEVKAGFERLRQQTNGTAAVLELQKLLDALCLVVVEINPESRVKVDCRRA